MPIVMTVTSFWYIVLILLGIVLYYLAPKRMQWIVLFGLSICFYYYSTDILSIFLPIFSALAAYIGGVLFGSEKLEQHEKIRKTMLVISIVLIILPWFFVRAFNSFIQPIGMAYYTCQLISYVIDVYWGNIVNLKNPVKVIAYTVFFPQLTTGPISRYSEMKAIFEEHAFQYKNLCFGAQRILWGFFKKLVIADRAAQVVNPIWNDPSKYTGLWSIVALLSYPILIYADFSGCMDIVLGTAEIFDIHLEENFNNPFFSRTVREFWNRWHITLGKWAKDYVMYPLLKSNTMIRFSKFSKKKFGKHLGKFISTALASAAVWLVMGIWHGGIKYIIGVSLFYWSIIEIGELIELIRDKYIKKSFIDDTSLSRHIFQMARTYFFYACGAVFFKAESVKEAVLFLKSCFFALLGGWRGFDINILFDRTIVKDGITWKGFNLLIVGIALLLIVGILREKHGYARNWIAKQNIFFRWIVWMALFFVVLIYGGYGPGFDASVFIYQGF